MTYINISISCDNIQKGGNMKVFCTYNDDYKDLVIIHPNNGIIDGRTLLFDEEDTMEKSGYFSVKEDEIVCKFLNGTLDDENCMDVNFQRIKELVDFTLLSDNIELTTSQERYRNYLTTSTLDTSNDTFRAKNVYYINEGKMVTATTYEFSSYECFFIFLIQIMIKNNCRIYRCKNCGKYFIPKRSDAFYCNNPAPNNGKKTCVQKINYENSLKAQKTDLGQKFYKQIYNALKIKMERTPSRKDFKNNLENFIQEATEFKTEIKNGNKTKEDFVQWLTDFKNKMKQ